MSAVAEPTPLKQPRKPANDPGVPHVALAIKAIMKEVRKEGISKDRKNQQQSYNFRGIDDVLNVLSGMLPEADLIVIPRMLSRTQVERTTAKGGVLFFSTVEADYTFKSTIDGSEHLVGPFYGEAMDSADKATNKAMSAAYKYMAIQTFCIPTEGDNDADATTHEVVANAAGGSVPSPARQRLISRDELADLQTRIDATGTDIVLFCKYMKVGALAELTAPDGYERALAALKAKADAKGAAQ